MLCLFWSVEHVMGTFAQKQKQNKTKNECYFLKGEYKLMK